MPENTEQDRLKLLWSYYAEASEKLGGKINNPNKQEGFSMWWYYNEEHLDLKGLGIMTRAFLGDRDAQKDLTWDEDIACFKQPPGNCYIEGIKAGGEGTQKPKKTNDSQEKAIRTALSDPISFIKGPPGTGKTDVILHLASCIAANGMKAAIVSNNNTALDNIYDKVQAFSDSCPNQKQLKKKLARLGNKDRIIEFVLQHSESEEYKCCGFEICQKEEIKPYPSIMKYLPERMQDREDSIKSEELTEEEKEKLPLWTRYEVKKKPQAEDFLKKYPVITSSVHSLQKCFKNGKKYQYDYIIIDETSQLDVVVGLTVMDRTRHLVLVGDSDQLSPVLKKDIVDKINQSEIESKIKEEQDGETYLLSENKSFLDVCLKIFDPEHKHEVMLNQHYRCHPGIFGFCKEYVYDRRDSEQNGKQNKEQGKIEICTPKANYPRTVCCDVPIKVLWFEGNYCEHGYMDKEKKLSSKHNMKQLYIFMEEELEYLMRYLREEENPSVSILSPFRGQLKEMYQAICGNKEFMKLCDKRNIAVENPESPDETEPDIITIGLNTVHKSQGKEFDIVYLLPVEDGDWEWPWSQKKRMVNVAVSRAVQELRIITSTALMEEGIQEILTDGRVIPPSRNLEGSERQEQEPEEMFIKKLVTYVRDKNVSNGCNGYPESEHGYSYGFHKTQLRSVFDQKTYISTQHSNGDPSAPETCLRNALKKMKLFTERDLKLYSEVPIWDILTEEEKKRLYKDKDLWKYAQNARLDFVICDKKDNILLAVEVDGEQHRHCHYWINNKNDREWAESQYEAQVWKDESKDELMKNYLHAILYKKGNRSALYREDVSESTPMGDESEQSFPFLRLPADGSTCLEVRALWEEAEQPLRDKFFTIEDLLEKQLESPCSRKAAVDFFQSTFNTGGDFIMSLFKVIIRYLQDCYKDVSKYYREETEEAAELFQTLKYNDNDKNPDYSNPYIQELYALRYMYAYGYEYREMFRRLFETEKIPRVVNILSIGCGNGIDYWAFRDACSMIPETERTNAFYSYTGIDLTDWKRKFGKEYIEKNSNAHYKKCDAGEFLRENQAALPYNIIVFPKSICEFPEDVFEQICDTFANAGFKFTSKGREYNTREVHFLVSMRWNENTDPEQLLDKLRSDRLIEAMERNGYRLKDEEAAAVYTGEDRKIEDCDTDFKYPEDIGKFMSELNYTERNGKPICYNPIKSEKYNCNRIMTFVRE